MVSGRTAAVRCQPNNGIARQRDIVVRLMSLKRKSMDFLNRQVTRPVCINNNRQVLVAQRLTSCLLVVLQRQVSWLRSLQVCLPSRRHSLQWLSSSLSSVTVAGTAGFKTLFPESGILLSMRSGGYPRFSTQNPYSGAHGSGTTVLLHALFDLLVRHHSTWVLGEACHKTSPSS